MAIKQLEINSKTVRLMKPVTGANYSGKTVLTNSAWEYVELWLMRQSSSRAKRALFYWGQAQNFYCASENLPIESRPLTSYYCCLNAAKALLAIKGPDNIDFDNLSHGICSDRKQWRTKNLSDAKVTFQGAGVLYQLSKYFGEETCKKEYTVYDLLYNIPCVHRTFSITYAVAELFIPVRDIFYIVDSDSRKGWVQFQIDERYTKGSSLRYLPNQFEKVKYDDGSNKCLMRLKRRFSWNIHNKISNRLEELSKYHGKVRKYMHYISGDIRLWYIKKNIATNTHILDRNSITLIFSVMHWLSELVRYSPERFNMLMGTKQNWLIHEFIDNALYQYIDEISCEMTGADIMPSGHRK